MIFKGEPLDYQRYRHTSLFIEPTNGDQPFIAHAVGPPGEYDFQARDAYDSTEMQSIARTVEVRPLSAPVGRAQVIELLRAVTVRNWDTEFNCQIWVETALRKLRDLQTLSSDAYTRGLDGMVDAIAEAEDEED